MQVKGGVAVLLAWLVVLVGISRVDGNGDTYRELQARVVAVDQQAGSLEIERQFRGKTWRVSLKLTPETLVFGCAETFPKALPLVRRTTLWYAGPQTNVCGLGLSYMQAKPREPKST